MPVHIAIPEPTSSDTAYNQRSLPQYTAALQSAGAIPSIVPLHERPDRVARLLSHVQGILLPGSGFDIDPQSYGADRIPACNPPDPARAAIDELLLQDAFDLHKPVLAICYGVQALNVWRSGTLLQDLPTQIETPVDHAPGRTIAEAHPVAFAPDSLLATLAAAPEAQVNSSHHQALRAAGENLRVTAVCPADGVIEAVELDSPDHYVLGVQWHPERTYISSPLSRAIFASFIHAATAWKPRSLSESVAAL
jgi:putative glutamine amidotransferase